MPFEESNAELGTSVGGWVAAAAAVLDGRTGVARDIHTS